MALLAAGCRAKPPAVTPAGFAPASRESFEQAAAVTMPAGREIVRISWKADDGDLQLSGNGAVRFAPPDSLRLDVAATLGLGRSTLILTGDSVQAQPALDVDKILPDRFALWAAMGIMHAPPGVVRFERAEQGTMQFWSTTDGSGAATVFVTQGGLLVSVTRERPEHVESELRLTRSSGGAVARANLTDAPHHFRLQVDVNRIEPSGAFAPEIWKLRP